MDANRIYENMKKLVAVPGVSGTPAEAACAAVIRDILMDMPYFREHPENVELVPLDEDPLGRPIVTAYLQCAPDSRDVLILTGHYDVVDAEGYGDLKDIAFDVDAITSRVNELPLDEDSQRDFNSGNWIFGRGTADMKIGHAMALELLREFSEGESAGSLKGNLLYVAVCGEETNSEGMLRAVPFFNSFAWERGLRYKALLLMECYLMEDQANDHVRHIHIGASGKVMPMFFFVGEATHAGEPFLGLDPNLLASEVYSRMYLNEHFCQTMRGETTPPPVCLKTEDLKTAYSVTTPLYAASYYNVISVDLDPAGMFEQLADIAHESFDAALDHMASRAAAYGHLFGTKPVINLPEPCVMTYSELYEAVKKTFRGDFDLYLRTLIRGWRKAGLELQAIAVRAVKTVYEHYHEKRPMIIISVIPPLYPDSYPDKDEPRCAALIRAADHVIDYAREKYGETLDWKDYYMGISDMSYTGLDPDKAFDTLFDNVVGANQIYTLPTADLAAFRVPGIVFGGYGKDFHKHTERLEKHYNFEVLPDLYVELIKTILS